MKIFIIKANGQVGFLMDMGRFIIKVVSIMKDQLLMDNHLELMEYLFILMVLIKEESLNKAAYQVQGNSDLNRGILHTKVSGFKMNLMEKVSKNFLMDRLIKVNLIMGSSKMFAEYILGLMERFLKVNFGKAIQMAMENYKC